jgi:glucosamine-6-phosphate deaminase
MVFINNSGEKKGAIKMRTYNMTSSVEEKECARTGHRSMYAPTEKIAIVEVDNFPMLGKLTALRFIEWVIKNPGGVISLPTGKTPEMFIKWTTRILKRWDTKVIQDILAEYGIDGSRKPDMKALSFVQIDEFYPVNASQHNSFNYYVREFYIKGFGLDPARALLIDATSLGLPRGVAMKTAFPDGEIDLSLRFRQVKSDHERLQKEIIDRVDEFCMDYETKIRAMGGIGFFLGGIGPDGHIAFNVRGSSAYSVTRLTRTNYETQAAASTDLGGIEISRTRLVMTIGIATITYNPTSTVIISAAGDSKIGVVRSAVEENKHSHYPASFLQDMTCARFYVTSGLANMLTQRRVEALKRRGVIDAECADDIVIGRSLSLNKPLRELTKEDFERFPLSAELLARAGAPHTELAEAAYGRIVAKIDKGISTVSGKTFLHTEPHQDDGMLGYLSLIYHLVRDPSNRHHFANLTSGFTSVTNPYFLAMVRKLSARLELDPFQRLFREGYFSGTNADARMQDVYLFLDGSAERSREKKDEAEARRLMRNLMEVHGTEDLTVIRLKIRGLEEYLSTQYPGAKDPPDIQILKGTVREWEAELLWAYFGIEASDVHALRLGFYQGDIFSEEPQVARDVIPIFGMLKKIRPDIISVAFDPEGSGPDTHYKALQAVAEAVRMYDKESGASGMRIWGYRNVWYRFKPAEADCMVPVSLNTLSLLHTAFMNCFGSQSAASFPSHEHDGPFSELAQKNQVEQYGMVKTCLGRDFFLKHQHPRLRAARGMIFLKDMSLQDFFDKVRELKKATEAA